MTTEDTSLAQALMYAEDKIRYDAACKRILAEKIILAWILKYCVKEYNECNIKEIADYYIEGEPNISKIAVMPDQTNPTMIHGSSNEDSSLNEGTILYDIRFYAKAPNGDGLISLILNIEAQNDFHPGYPLISRALYYCSRMISSQYNVEFSESRYGDIKKVYSIWICTNPPKNRENTITGYHITEENIVGEVHEKREYYDLMTAVMLCLGEAESVEENNVVKLLNVLLSKEMNKEEKQQILEDDFDIAMSMNLEREVSLMCNLSKGIEDKGINKGIQMTEIKSIKTLMETLNFTAEQAMNALKIDEDKKALYLKELDVN